MNDAMRSALFILSNVHWETHDPDAIMQDWNLIAEDGEHLAFIDTRSYHGHATYAATYYGRSNIPQTEAVLDSLAEAMQWAEILWAKDVVENND